MNELLRAAAGAIVPDTKPDPPGAGSFDGGRDRGAPPRRGDGEDMESLLRDAAGQQPPSEGGSS